MTFSNNKKEFRYEATNGTDIAYLSYRWLKGSMVLMHTVVPPAMQGSGVGSALVKYVLDDAREKGLYIVVYCTFVKAYIDKHIEYADLIDPAHHR